jgi:hypothetical protein
VPTGHGDRGGRDRHHDAYANVHTALFPGGEIRAQINDRRGKGRGDDD